MKVHIDKNPWGKPMLPDTHTFHFACRFRVSYHACMPLHPLHVQRDPAMARLLSALFFYSMCFLISFYPWYYVFSSFHSESRSQLHPAAIHRLLHRSNGSIHITQQLATAGSHQSILKNMSSVQGLAQAAQKRPGKSLLKGSTHCTSTLPLYAGLDHLQSGLEYISGDQQTFLRMTIPFFKGFWSCRYKKRHYWGVTGHPHHKLEAHLVTLTQLQDGLPLTDMSGSVILSAMLLTEFSFLHPNNPWILSTAVYFWLALLCRTTKKICKGHPAHKLQISPIAEGKL